MSEHDTNPQRQPDAARAEPPGPTGEPLPPAAEWPHATAESPHPTGQSAHPTAELPRIEPESRAAESAPPADAGPPRTEGPAPDSSSVPRAPGSAAPPHWQAPQHPQPGWAGTGYAAHGPTPYPHVPQQSGLPPASAPPWGYAPANQPPRRPSWLGKTVAAGAAALVLMAGSGVAGGLVTLALTDNSAPTKTYAAAPILNSADLPSIAAAVENSVVSINTGSGEGSGVVLTADGYVLTNNHVVASAEGDTVNVAFADGTTARARIVGTDPKTDLAIVKAEGVSGLVPAKLGDSDAMRVGDTVLALGSPLGLQGSVTAGIISARDRTIQAGEGNPGVAATSISGLLQTDAPINPGNSGGALVNTRGEVIGINTAIATAGQSSGNIGVGFAIPSNKAKQVAEALRAGKKISHPYLGVSVKPADNGGAVVAAVSPGSPAAKADLREGDVITDFGGKAINDSDDLVAAVQTAKVGDRVEITYHRNGTENKATVTLAEAS